MDSFILPLIQGFVEIRPASLSFLSKEDPTHADTTYGPTCNPAQGLGIQFENRQDFSMLPDFFTIALISRRSQHRAGEVIDMLIRYNE